MLDPFDHSQCSFPIPTFTSESEQRAWVQGLTFEQWLEVMRVMHIARYGADAVNRPMDRSKLEVLTMEQFVRRKEEQERKEQAWRARNGWP